MTKINMDPESIEKGVSGAFLDWIQLERPISTGEDIQDGVKAAVTDWLDKHSDDVGDLVREADDVGDLVREAVKEAVTEYLDENGLRS